MPKIQDYVEVVSECTRDEFVRHHAHTFLLLEQEDDGQQSGGWSFKTATIANKAVKISRLLDQQGMLLSEESERFEIFQLVKSAGNPWHERISIGRARNNDIVLPYKSISKLHAYLTIDEDSLLLADAGSRNGTRINDERMTTAQPTPIGPGDTITLGLLSLEVLAPGDLYDLIRLYLRPKQARDQ